MIEHVYRRVSAARVLSDVLVATDDLRIATRVRDFGGKVRLTKATHETGTDRLAEVAASVDCDVVVNVQGDEPLIDPRAIDELVAPFATDAAYNINVDSDGDAKADATFRWTFHNIDKRGGNTFLYNNGPVTSIDDPNLLFRQTYTLQSSFHGAAFKTRVSNAPVAPSRVGPASMPDYGTLRSQA